MRVEVKVPATSANLGSGFDSVGIALTMYNAAEFEEYDRILVTSEKRGIHLDERNIIVKTAQRFYAEIGRPFKGLKVTERSTIPMTRGLGSSSACTVAAVMGANALAGNPMSCQDMINLSAAIEGHPDNSTPAIRGGFVAAVMDNGHVWQVRVPISHKVRFCALIPGFELKTEKARAALPDMVPRRDAVFNLSRAALLAGSLVTGDLENLRTATQDALAQPYRFGLIPNGAELIGDAVEMGALGAYISGAGPTIMTIISRDDGSFEANIKRLLRERYPGWYAEMLDCDECGAEVRIIE